MFAGTMLLCSTHTRSNTIPTCAFCACLVCRLCMVCLNQNHPVMGEDIVGVDFFHDYKINVSGKMKNELLTITALHNAGLVRPMYLIQVASYLDPAQGSQRLTPSSPLCFVQCKGGRKYCLYR